MIEWDVPPEFQPKRKASPASSEPPASVVELETMGAELLNGLGETTQPDRLNVARLNLADRYEQLRRVTRKRDAGKLTACYHRLYAELFDRKLKLDRVELTRPPKPAPAPPAPVGEPPRRKTVAEALMEAMGS